jgi:elongation factor G
MNEILNVRNIGISAHIDSGKTTLSERILFYTGKIHAIHEVKGKDGVGATMDSMELEREKGISIQAAASFCEWKDYTINLIDTPGHVDFTIEVERALRVLDGAILVLDSVAGVQSQSITVDRQMRRYNVPRLAFINKMDKTGADCWRVTRSLQEKLNHNALNVQMPIGMGAEFEGVIDLIAMKAYYFDGENGENVREENIPAALQKEAEQRRLDLIEKCADLDDDVAHAFLSDHEVTNKQIKRAIRKATLALKATPVFIGSAFRNKGVQLLLDGVVDYLPNPTEVMNTVFDRDNNEKELPSDPEKPLVALAFKLQDGRFGQLTYMRIYQGKISKGDVITNCTANEKRTKVPRLVRMHADEMIDIQSASAGDIVALFGVECATGDTFTDGNFFCTMTPMFVPEPVISLAVAPKAKAFAESFSKALNRFTKEDPTLGVHLDEESGQTILSGMGELQLDIYIERMRREYNCDVLIGKPKVAYREAITQKVEFSYTHKKQTGGKGQFAKVEGYIEPLPADAVQTFEFVDDTKGGAIPEQFMTACEKGFRDAVKKGSLIGYPIVGVRVVVDNGQSHPVDSSELAFATASVMAFRQVYMSARPTVLQPIMKVEAQAPEEYQGVVVGQLNRNGGVITSCNVIEGSVIVTADVPLAKMFGYSTDLRSATQGKGEFTMEFLKYAPVPKQEIEELILQQRKANAAANGNGHKA